MVQDARFDYKTSPGILSHLFQARLNLQNLFAQPGTELSGMKPVSVAEFLSDSVVCDWLC